MVGRRSGASPRDRAPTCICRAHDQAASAARRDWTPRCRTAGRGGRRSTRTGHRTAGPGVRIERVRHVLGVDLADPDERLALHLACRSVLFHS
ncbi:helix-turn-helix domain-containing protein [Pseudonocardia alni]|uniref:helix-turn-helix domain-containing protein n=1 Tax=Pseudonocardia alni TaxID=33907 RepID=UPI0037CBDC48